MKNFRVNGERVKANDAFDTIRKYKLKDSDISERLEKYKNTGKFDGAQLAQIELGLEQHVDVPRYANPKFDDRQMAQIRYGLDHRVDISKYADPKFDEHQMWQIRLGLENHLDVSKYADPKFDWRQMQEIRHQLEKGTYKDSK